MTITTADYPVILDAIMQKHLITLDFENDLEEDDDTPEEDWVALGYLSFEAGRSNTLNGDFMSDAWLSLAKDWDAALKRRLRPFCHEDGEIGLEISYFPLAPDQRNVALVYANTLLSDLMTLQEFTDAVTNKETWVEDCFGSHESDSLYFEVTPADRGSVIAKDPGGADMLLVTPIPVERDGVEYHIYVWESSD